MLEEKFILNDIVSNSSDMLIWNSSNYGTKNRQWLFNSQTHANINFLKLILQRVTHQHNSYLPGTLFIPEGTTSFLQEYQSTGIFRNLKQLVSGKGKNAHILIHLSIQITY